MQNSLTQIIYLESYVESTLFLPTELQVRSGARPCGVRCCAPMCAARHSTTRGRGLPARGAHPTYTGRSVMCT